MSTHTAHPDVHDHGLADGCPRCAEHARSPLVNLDDPMLGQLLRRIVSDQPARSDAEREAMIMVQKEIRWGGPR